MSPTPHTTTALTNDGRVGQVLEWEEARRRLADGGYYWLATLHPDGRPQLRPVLAVWVGERIYTTSSPAARKGRNLERDGRCAIAIEADGLQVTIEGTASKVVDPGELEAVADAYRSKYGWPVEIVDGAFYAPYGAPTAGSAPFQPYGIRVESAFGFVVNEKLGPASTKWELS